MLLTIFLQKVARQESKKLVSLLSRTKFINSREKVTKATSGAGVGGKCRPPFTNNDTKSKIIDQIVWSLLFKTVTAQQRLHEKSNTRTCAHEKLSPKCYLYVRAHYLIRASCVTLRSFIWFHAQFSLTILSFVHYDFGIVQKIVGRDFKITDLIWLG